MTRFARAKGSKASNEKKPEEPTSWAEMKNSMLSKKSNKTEDFVRPKVKTDPPKQTEWASLGDDISNSGSTLKQNLNKKNKNSDNCSDNSNSNVKFKEKKEKNLKNIKTELEPKNELKFEKKNRKRNCLDSEDIDLDKSSAKVRKKNRKRKLEEDSGVMSSNKKNKTENTGEIVYEGEEKHKNSEFKDRKKFHKVKKEMKKKYFKYEFKGNSQFKNSNRRQYNENFNKYSKNDKKFKNKNFSERNSGVEELIINGEKIPIIKFQGFYVTLEDAERLKKLRNEMIKEGIPKAKLEAAIKLERRRAEKALSRLKKSLCFNCRGHGHLLSNCPKLIENENTSTGICYKCGSTEHSAADCKVVKGATYQFAECFICKEQGHIAKQCPDNPRGLYPQGGACRECGDVTHLRKDCPKVVSQKTEDVVSVGLRNDRNLECLDEEIAIREKQNVKNKGKKSLTVKF